MPPDNGRVYLRGGWYSGNGEQGVEVRDTAEKEPPGRRQVAGSWTQGWEQVKDDPQEEKPPLTERGEAAGKSWPQGGLRARFQSPIPRGPTQHLGFTAGPGIS